MKNYQKLLLISAIALNLSIAFAANALASNAKNTYQKYLDSLKNCSPEMIERTAVNQCKKIVNQAINWANSYEGKHYINMSSNKRTEFVYSIQQAYKGIDTF